jgi:hypothetical protein
MNLQCDYCTATASGTEIELLDEGWARITLSAPLRETFTACPDHGTEMTKAAFEAIERTSTRHKEILL